MFGNNPMRTKDHGNGESLVVHSIFNTIQGEGPYAGRAATFVRLHGCHLACTFCDTDFESVLEVMSIDRIADAAIANVAASLVVLTGGEPMRQNILPLCELLVEKGYQVQIETAGTFWIEGFEKCGAEIVVSPKTPKVHDMITKHARAWKYIVSRATMEIHEGDGLPLASTQVTGGPKHRLARPDKLLASLSPERIYVQPMDEQEEWKNKENVNLCRDLCLQHGYSISLQQHKILEVA